MSNLIAQLEAMGSGRPAEVEAVEGVWELVYSDVAPFRASPFFMTVGKVMEGTTLSAEEFFRLHRLATRGSEIGKVGREGKGRGIAGLSTFLLKALHGEQVVDRIITELCVFDVDKVRAISPHSLRSRGFSVVFRNAFRSIWL
jgi:hypothetical protein